MVTRRGLARAAVIGVTEAALARRALIADPRPGMVWLNANEFPTGPPPAVVSAMSRVLEESNRYHYEEFESFLSTLGASINLPTNHLLVGAGSTEVLHCAVEAFTGRARPFITAWPTFEAGPELAAAKGFPVVKVKLTPDYASDVERLAYEANRAGGGLIYVCNPNNPTSSITEREHIRWLIQNLPAHTYLVVDEAYLHFTDSPLIETALSFVGKARVVVLRTFSKIYGMAGVRVGFAAAGPDLIDRMTPYRNNVISIMGVRGALAILQLGSKLIEDRRTTIAGTRSSLTQWCRANYLGFIEPHANFVLIDTGIDVREVSRRLLIKGVVPGRPFPPYDRMVRITIGSDRDMVAFKTAFSQILGLPFA